MSATAEPRCPDCTYRLTGLGEPRCPECGLKFDARLLTDPTLARPRPAWERRPRVSFVAAVWHTVVYVTFRPNSFFASIQQPDRLRRSISWAVCTIAMAYVVVVAYFLGLGRIGGFAGVFSGMSLLQYLGAVLWLAAITVFRGVLLVLFPLVTMLLVADLLLWRDRDRYRLFFKGAMYSMSVYLWLAVGVCAVRASLQIYYAVTGTAAPGVTAAWFWASWMAAGAMTWQYALLYHAVLGARFATLLPPRPARTAVLALLVVAVWLGSVYLALFDRHLGLRFATAAWSWDLI